MAHGIPRNISIFDPSTAKVKASGTREHRLLQHRGPTLVQQLETGGVLDVLMPETVSGDEEHRLFRVDGSSSPRLA
jgi:hypothetical protein